MKRRKFIASLFALPTAAVVAVKTNAIVKSPLQKLLEKKMDDFGKSWQDGMVITWTELRQDGITIRD